MTRASRKPVAAAERVSSSPLKGQRTRGSFHVEELTSGLPTNIQVGKRFRDKGGGPIVVPPDLDSLVEDVKVLLESADADQANLTRRYIEAGRRLRRVREACRQRKVKFKEVLARDFRGRERSTLYEYMTLAKKFDAADPETKVQLFGLFKDGWAAVLAEIRRRNRDKRFQKRGTDIAVANAHVENLTIMEGDCMVRLRDLPDESVDCCITSFPYFRCLVFPDATTTFGGNRDCTHDWQMRRSTRNLCGPRSVSRNRRPATIENGTCRKCNAELVMLGWEDSVDDYVRHVVTVCAEVKRVLKPSGVFWLNIADTYSDKELKHVPHRVAIALADDGWICRQAPIWHVLGKAPEKAELDRLTRDHENLFMFVKQRHYYFDAAAAGNRRTVWSIPNERIEGNHPCAFPRALVEPMLLSSCPEGGVCLDPLAGTGTTALVALAYRREAILIEANKEYCAIAKHRIETELDLYKAEIEGRQKPIHSVVSRSQH